MIWLVQERRGGSRSRLVDGGVGRSPGPMCRIGMPFLMEFESKVGICRWMDKLEWDQMRSGFISKDG